MDETACDHFDPPISQISRINYEKLRLFKEYGCNDSHALEVIVDPLVNVKQHNTVIYAGVTFTIH